MSERFWESLDRGHDWPKRPEVPLEVAEAKAKEQQKNVAKALQLEAEDLKRDRAMEGTLEDELDRRWAEMESWKDIWLGQPKIDSSKEKLNNLESINLSPKARLLFAQLSDIDANGISVNKLKAIHPLQFLA